MGKKGYQGQRHSASLVNTKMTTELPQMVVDGFTQHTLLKRLAEPEEVANVICFLLSPLSSFMTGQVIT